MAELNVSKKSIGKLFKEMQGKKFIIPDYQRPYQWDEEKCETLWIDIENFFQNKSVPKSVPEYFLGTIVSFVNDEENQEIIDGQQRITSFMLLLRSFYKKLEDMKENDEVRGLKFQLAPCIWDINNISQKIDDKAKIRIESKVATESDNKIFYKILETGNVIDKPNDNYSKNYQFFKKKCDEFANNQPIRWQELCVTILNRCIVLPIECKTQDTALTIFSTLNDRGMPLADSDIFKAQIYNNYKTEEKQQFVKNWKELTEICKEGKISIDDIFRYYSHILRARKNDKSKEVGLRKFYAKDNYQDLKSENLIEEIMDLAFFWRFLETEDEPKNEYNYIVSTGARKWLHCLKSYPNEYWKYITSVFFLKWKESKTFEKDFEKFLKKLIAFLFAKFIERPTVNAIKDDIYNACIDINTNQELTFKFSFNKEIFNQKMEEIYGSRIAKALLLLHAYLDIDQKELIPNEFHIEHIFPQSWQNTNYNGWSKEDASLYLNKFGNKVVIEKRVNIQAGNGYFGQKKQRYANSKIAAVLKLSKYEKDDWVKEDIEKREEDFKSEILNFFSTNLLNN